MKMKENFPLHLPEGMIYVLEFRNFVRGVVPERGSVHEAVQQAISPRIDHDRRSSGKVTSRSDTPVLVTTQTNQFVSFRFAARPFSRFADSDIF